MEAIDRTRLPIPIKAEAQTPPKLDWLETAKEAMRMGKKGSKFNPIPIEGEPLSATILRDRGPY